MTIFRLDFQDLIVFEGLHQWGNCHENISSCWYRCCWYRIQSFPERSPVILLVASTLLAHLSNRLLVSVASTVHKQCCTVLTTGVTWRRKGLCTILRSEMRNEFIAALFYALLVFHHQRTRKKFLEANCG